ncbi:SusC/RagA family TonB-linked outer membrane protein [Catalinimonas niigatensis]|uniref:SusC/RagA family TonB-linked outer membrane protein n=1 Tax=Catalinimonas niigatensis TaxID=1397264 RepID=UPI002666313D|nr:TonB-dependent receptor [Catalinimonas niigatensis]WPP50423.1 TonB-dependent receptor [Catalinimonas niigatensis]
MQLKPKNKPAPPSFFSAGLRLLFSLLLGSYLLFPYAGIAQNLALSSAESFTSGKQGAQKLSDFLDKLGNVYQIKFVYESELIDNKVVKSERIESDQIKNDDKHTQLEKLLSEVLTPLELTYEKVYENYYVIQKKAEKARSIEILRRMNTLEKEKSRIANNKSVQRISSRMTNNMKPMEQSIRGKVTDGENGEPLPGVNVLAKGTSTGTVTDIDGSYRLSVGDEVTTLVFSSIGYVSEEIEINGQNLINIAMMPDIQSLSEVVVVGYGAVKKSDLTGSVSSISQEEITALPVNNVQQIMQGRAPGVQVIQNSHAPGGGLSVRIRGANSILGGNDPLYVVDGFVGGISLDAINPNDIESIEILKDASATAIYGSRGANGVVIITTKRGTKGNDQVNFDAYYGTQQVANTIDVMNARQFAEIANARVLNDGGTELPFPDLNNLPYDTDWQDEVFRTAPIQNYSLSFNGGNENTQYLISANYFDQDGIVINTDFSRATIRANLDKKIGKRFKVSNSFQVSRVMENTIPEGQDKGPLASALAAYPTRPVMENGEFAQMDIQGYGGFSDPIPNPVAEITQTLRESKVVRLFDMIYGEYEIAEGLKAKVSLGASYSNRRSDYYQRSTIPGTTVNGVARIRNEESIDILNENTLSYNKTIGTHAINAVAGFTSQRNEYTFFDAGSRDFVTDILETGDLSSGATIDVPSSGGTIWSQQSFLGRVNYVLQDKYLVTVTGRYDGSSRVAKKNRWTFFPSFALGWRVNEEPFMANLSSISNLKLRVSWGQTGNDRIPSYLSQQRISATTLSSGEQIVVGLAPINLPSSELDWEVTSQFDVGLDVGFLEERIRLTADFYQKNTSNLLAQIQLPLSVGYSNVTQNIGELKNTGFELGLGGDIVVNDFTWTLDANFSMNRNEITRLKGGKDVFASGLPGGASAGAFHIIREGEPLASYFGFVENGLDEAGDITYQDLDDNGVINNEDRTLLGNFFPDFIYGLNSNFSWKGFDLNVFFQGVEGTDMIRLDKFRSANSLTRGYNQLVEVTDYWTPENQDAQYPQPRSGINFRGSDSYVEDASYLRLKNLQLGYALPLTDMGVSWMRTAKVYASVQNLLTITNYTGYDPEINNQGNSTVGGNTDLRLGLDLSSYPSARTFTFGVKLGL